MIKINCGILLQIIQIINGEQIYPVSYTHLELNNKKIKTRAMIDTGNLLKEPITNTPVIVLEHTLLYECVPKEILDNLESILGGELVKIPEEIRNEYISRLKMCIRDRH